MFIIIILLLWPQAKVKSKLWLSLRGAAMHQPNKNDNGDPKNSPLASVLYSVRLKFWRHERCNRRQRLFCRRSSSSRKKRQATACCFAKNALIAVPNYKPKSFMPLPVVYTRRVQQQQYRGSFSFQRQMPPDLSSSGAGWDHKIPRMKSVRLPGESAPDGQQNKTQRNKFTGTKRNQNKHPKQRTHFTKRKQKVNVKNS